MTQLTIFNSLKRKKEQFVPVNSEHVRLYACGPTVYNYAHIGNARMAVVFDLLANILKTLYPQVTYASNITDVDDKIIKAHKETGEPISTITEKYTRIYNEDMAALGCSKPNIQPRATETISEMIKIIEQLIERGHAYAADGHALFNVPSFDQYGGLSGRSRDEQIAGARIEVASYKKDPADFVLWKPSKDDEPGWDSPWGRGRPGWHIECSAMSEKHLGLPFDIHGGGADLKFPHHENEIAQSCCAHGEESDMESYSKYWMHNGFVTVEGEKMSKSLGNFLLVNDLLEKYKGEVLRLTLLSAHYRQPLDWSEDKLHQSQKQLDRFYKRLEQMSDIKAEKDVQADKVFAALCDDLNTPLALAEINTLLKEENSPALKAKLSHAGKLLNILQADPNTWLDIDKENITTDEYEALLQERTQAKTDKNWSRADEIRNELAAKGFKIIDTSKGPKLEKI